MENPDQIIRSWTLQGNYSNGDVSQDKLVPDAFTRVRTPFVNTWRTEQVSNILDWGAQSFSYFLPESLRVVSSLFLRIELPAISNGNYKDIPGLYAVERLRFLTNGTEAYHCEPGQFLRDYIESLTDEQAAVFTRTYLGYMGDGGTQSARVIMVPILLPNSAYNFRNGRNSHGHGVWPAYLGTSRLEVQVTMAPAANLTKAGADAPASIAGAISVLTHVVQMTPEDMLEYSNSRGKYSVMTRRFTELTNGYTNATGGSRIKLQHSQPQGNVTELFAIAVPQGDHAKAEIQSMIQASHFSIESDSVIQRSLDSPEKVAIELWSNGFVGNKFANSPSRLCFAAHAATAENIWSGAYNMHHSSQINVELEFAVDVSYRVFAVQLQRTTIAGDGNITATLK